MYPIMDKSDHLETLNLENKIQGLVLHHDLIKYNFKHANKLLEVEHARKSPDYQPMMNVFNSHERNHQ